MKAYAYFAATAVIASSTAVAAPVELADFVALARPQPTEIIRYGESDSQAIDLFIPEGEGPHPVAILIHGGCWKNIPGAGREQLRHMGEALADRGLAVWSIGYRRADEPGGGYPGTFDDVGAAIDLLQQEAPRREFDLARSVMVGHSAGGHLALWASARDRLPPDSGLRGAGDFAPRSVISLAGVGDLREFGRFIPVICGPEVLDRLVPTRDGDPHPEISPAEMPPPRARVVMISAVLDRLVPPYVAHDYARAMEQRHGWVVERTDVPDAGHFDLVMPGTRAWDEVMARIVREVNASS